MKGEVVENINEERAKLIIDTLVKSSVRHFFIAPGSRSAPLIAAVSENPLAEATIHFDERGLSFAAVGAAKAINAPVCLICTSGTALGNLFPALIEAQKSLTPLIIISADRPQELRDVGANQTIDQVKFFGDYINWEFDLNCSDLKLPASSIESVIHQAVYRSIRSPKGGVHINCMFREPLFVPSTKKKKIELPKKLLAKTKYYESSAILPDEELERIASEISSFEKGIILAGEMSSLMNVEAIFSLAMKLQWPIFADPTSGLREMGQDSSMITHYNHILQTTYSSEKMVPEVILHFGGPFVSKPLLKWLEALEPKKYLHVGNFPSRQDPNSQVTDAVESEPSLFCQGLLNFIENKVPSLWLSLWKEYSLNIEMILGDFFQESFSLSEPYAIFSLIKRSLESSNYFFGTSLPVRYSDSFFFPENRTGRIFANRGASGIDGLIATVFGIAKGGKKGVTAFIGDLSFFHDMNSLFLLKRSPFPIRLVVLNNFGGGIYEFLPYRENQPLLDNYLSCEHTQTLDEIAKAFNIPYVCPKDVQEYEEQLDKPLTSSLIIEVKTERKENFALHQRIEETLRKKMMRSKKEKELCYFASERVK